MNMTTMNESETTKAPQSSPAENFMFNKMMDKRFILVSGEVNGEMSNRVIQQMLCLAIQDPEKDITLLINSPGGHVTEGLAMHDVMRSLPCDVSTVCLGLAASMGSFLLAAGTKGKRYTMKNSEIMIHQVLGGISGNVTNMEIQADLLRDTANKMNKMLAEYTGKDVEQVAIDTDRDNFMTAEEAVEYGLVDAVITKLPFM